MDLTQKKYNILISLFLTVLYFVLVQLISGFIFFLNDDRTLQFILSGHSAEPSFYTFFLSWHIAMPISGLYTLFPAFPFYGVIMVCSMFLSLWYLTYFILKRQKNIIFGIIFILLIFVCLYRIVCRPTFTLAAAFAVMPIVLIALEFDFSSKNGLAKNLILIGAFSLLSIGFRHSVFLLSLPFVALIVLLKAFKADKKILLIVPVLAVCYAFSAVGNMILQNNTEYKQAIEYSQVRSDIFDHYGMPSYYGNEEFFGGLGISENAYNMMQNYFFDIPEASIENLKAIRDFQKEHYQLNLENNLRGIWDSYYSNYELSIIVVLLLLLSLFFNLKKGPKNWLIVLGFLGGTLLISLLLAIIMKFPTRIASVLLLFNLALCVFMVSDLIQPLRQRGIKPFRILQVVSGCLVVIVACCVFLPNNGAYDNSWKIQVAEDYRALEQHVFADSEYVYYTYSTVNLHYADAPFLPSQKAQNCIICDWNYLLPSYNQFFKNHGAESLMDYVEKGKKLKFIISQNDVITETCFYKYVNGKYGKTFTKVEDFGTFQIYEII